MAVEKLEENTIVSPVDKSKDLPTHKRPVPAGGCIIEKMVGKYGPYRYHVKRVGKRQIWTYLGKASELPTLKHGAELVSEGVHE